MSKTESMGKFLTLEKEKLLEIVVDVLRDAEYPIAELEIARRILVKHFGDEWWKKVGSHYIWRRLGMRIIQLLGMKPHGEANRKRLGIGYSVADSPNHPLLFYLEKQAKP